MGFNVAGVDNACRAVSPPAAREPVRAIEHEWAGPTQPSLLQTELGNGRMEAAEAAMGASAAEEQITENEAAVVAMVAADTGNMMETGGHIRELSASQKWKATKAAFVKQSAFCKIR